jgi:hypothetical protein
MNDPHDNAADDKAVLERLQQPDQVTEDALREHAAQRPSDEALAIVVDLKVRLIRGELREALNSLERALDAERQLDDLFEQFDVLPGRDVIEPLVRQCADIIDHAESLRRKL